MPRTCGGGENRTRILQAYEAGDLPFVHPAVLDTGFEPVISCLKDRWLYPLPNRACSVSDSNR